MRHLGVILSCFLSVSCASEYVYKDLSSEREQKQLSTVSTYIHAYEQTAAIQGLEVDDSDTVTTISSTSAKGSSLIHSGPGIQAVGDKAIKWQRVKNGDPQHLRTLSVKNLGKPCPSTGDHPWDLAYQQMICHHLARAVSTMVVQTSSPLLLAVEPEYGFYDERYVELMKKRQEVEQAQEITGDTSSNTTITDQMSPFWPGRSQISWYLGDEFTELKTAQKVLKEKLGEMPLEKKRTVKGAHLDSGYFEADDLNPEHLNREESLTCLLEYNGKNGKIANTPDRCIVDSKAPLKYRAGRSDMNHGSRTLSVLAGKPVSLDAQRYPGAGLVSAYPDLNVASFRITRDMPVHFFPSEMASAIVKATDSKFDVISLSQGGFPSLYLQEAINHAYTHGTAIFAATGDFFYLPIIGSLTPHTVAFPARFNRVMAVGALTADRTNYADNPCLFCLWRFWKIDSWSMRGSYGPESVMAGHSISAYAPNITTSVSTKNNKNAIQLDGDGVSFAVPQVAGAAAMWLARYGGDFKEAEWRSWMKVESVYQALMQSARKDFPEYSCEFMGEGALRAALALKYDRGTVLSNDAQIESPARPQSTIGLTWVYDMLVSWDLVKDGLGLVIGTTTLNEKLINSVREMAFMEIQQILHRSDAASALFNQMVAKSNAKSCPTKVRQDLVKEFIALILSEKNKSNFLTTLMKKRLLSVDSKPTS